MSTQQTTSKPRKRVPRPELSIFEEELNVPFNKKEFLPDLPPHARDLPAPPTPADPTESGHKPDTNRAQSEHKADTKPDTNRAQSGHKQIGVPRALNKTGHKADTEADTGSDTKRTQTAHKADTNSGFSSLVGLQREVAIFVYRACQYARAQVTDPLTLEHISISLKIRIGSVKTTLRRLEEKAILERVEFRTGRGGWSKYCLPETIFREMLQLETGHKLDTNRTQIEHKPDTEADTEPDTRRSSSSSLLDSKNLKTTTTEAEFADKKDQQYSAWNSVDPSPLAEFGFTQSHVIQLARDGKLSVEEVQDSIHFFAFDLKRNGKGKEIKGPPVSFFMGILRKGVPYAPPSNFESPEEAARRLYVESKRRLKERRESQEQEIKELEFSEWRNELTREAINGIVPEVSRSFPKLSESALKAHFDENVWPERRAAVPGLVAAEQADIRQQIEQSLEQGSTS